MNRRSFFKNAAIALAGFTILPGAGRVWKATPNVFDHGIYHEICKLQPYQLDTIELLTDRETLKQIRMFMVKYYSKAYA